MALLPLTRPIFALFLAYGLVFVVASGVTRGERARRVRALAGWVCSLGPAVFLLFWCFVAGFGALVLNPAAEPAPDTVEGVVEPAPLVTAQAVPPFVVGRVVIECLGNGRSYHVSETMAGPRRINLRAPSGRTVTVEVPVVGPWADSREWRDAAPRRDNLNVEDADEVDTLEGVPGSDVALQRCPPTPAIHPRWRISVRALRPGDRVVVGHALSGEGPFLWRGDLASVHDDLDIGGTRRRGGIGAGLFGLAALAALAWRRRIATWMDSVHDLKR